jgi:ligand-binding sensor protein
LQRQTYTGVVLDLLQQQAMTPSNSFAFCQKLRQDLKLKDADHFAALEAIAVTHPTIFSVSSVQPFSPQLQDEITLAKTIARPLRPSKHKRADR